VVLEAAAAAALNKQDGELVRSAVAPDVALSALNKLASGLVRSAVATDVALSALNKQSGELVRVVPTAVMGVEPAPAAVQGMYEEEAEVAAEVVEHAAAVQGNVDLEQEAEAVVVEAGAVAAVQDTSEVELVMAADVVAQDKYVVAAAGTEADVAAAAQDA
jgi:hypothetical protein